MSKSRRANKVSKQEDSDFQKLHHPDKRVKVNQNSQSQDSACYQPGGSKFFGALENSASLEEPKFIYQSVANMSNISTDHSSRLLPQTVTSEFLPAESSQLNAQPTLDVASSHRVQDEVVQTVPSTVPPRFEETISLLEERLIIDSQKRKVGEVIVRKEIETRIVEVPVRREKLIVEQISPTFKQLAVVDLGQMQETEFDRLATAPTPLLNTTAHEFENVDAAIQFLNAIASESSAQKTIHISLVSKDELDRSFNS
jgi:hypothetical protein